MGLGLYVGDERVAGWSYSGFHAFRERVAAAVGIDLNKMEGFHDVDKAVLEKEGWQAYRDAMLADEKAGKISWDSLTENVWDVIRLTDAPRENVQHEAIKALMPLLHHSDCDGEIEAKYCKAIADQLEKVIVDWPESIQLRPTEELKKLGYPPSLCFPDYDKQQARGLIEGLRKAAETGQVLQFC